MANVLADTFWQIDTASATALTLNPVHIKNIVWTPGAAAVQGDECKVTDNSATPIVIYDHFASGAVEDVHPVAMDPKKSINGLIVPTLAHGVVTIFLA